MAKTYSEKMREELGAEILKKPATRQELYVLVDQLVEKFAAFGERLDALETKGLEFTGTHQRGLEYRRGQAVVAKGSLWIATTATDAAPGENGD